MQNVIFARHFALFVICDLRRDVNEAFPPEFLCGLARSKDARLFHFQNGEEYDNPCLKFPCKVL